MKNLTVAEYIKKGEPSEYNFLKYLNPNNSYLDRQLNVQDLTYEEVKAVLRTLQNINTWEDISNVFETCFKISKNQFSRGLLTEFFSAKFYILETFKKIAENENKLLSSVSADSMKWKAAGGNRLDKYSDVLSVNQLGKIYGIFPMDLGKRKYFDILTLLTVEKELKEIEAIYNKMK